MNLDMLKSILQKTVFKMVIVGTMLFTAGVIAFVILYAFADINSVIVGIIGGVLVVFGILLFVLGLRQIGKIKNGNHPLVKAIVDKDEHLVAWIFKKQLNSQVEGVTVNKRNSVIVVYNTGEFLDLKGRKISQDQLIDYFQKHFPNARYGYNQENKAFMTEQLGNKMIFLNALDLKESNT